MKHKYSKSDKILLVSMCLACLASYLVILFQPQHDLSERLIFSGIWVFVSFILITGMVGVIDNIPKSAVQVPKKPAIIVIAITIMLIGAIVKGSI